MIYIKHTGNGQVKEVEEALAKKLFLNSPSWEQVDEKGKPIKKSSTKK